MHVLERVGETLAERGAYLVFTRVPKNVPTGQDMARYFEAVGRARPERHTLAFGELDEALEWVERCIIEGARISRPEEKPLELEEMELFKARKAETLAALAACMQERLLRKGERLFARGDAGDELFLVRSGLVRILLPLEGGQTHHLATFGRGDFFGEMAFLDSEPRSANAVAEADTALYVLSRKRFDALSEAHRKLALNLLEGLARSLAIRLRYTNAELRTLEA
jgi:SulP family sulfate permease